MIAKIYNRLADWLVPGWALRLPDMGRPCTWCLMIESAPGPCRNCNDTGWIAPRN